MYPRAQLQNRGGGLESRSSTHAAASARSGRRVQNGSTESGVQATASEPVGRGGARGPRAAPEAVTLQPGTQPLRDMRERRSQQQVCEPVGAT